MELLNLWLPLIGGGVLLAIAISAWFADRRIVGIWFGFAGIVCLILLAALQLQEHEVDAKKQSAAHLQDEIAKRAYVGFELAAVFLDSPKPGSMTAWIRLRNTGATPAYKLRGWQKFHRRLTGDLPFAETGKFENESIVAPGSTINLESTLSLTEEQLGAIQKGKLSLFVWGHVEYEDVFKNPRHFTFKGMMNGPVETVPVDGQLARGWGFRPIKDGIDAN